MKLKNKVAIVTGAANGIGRAVALSLAKEGASIAVADIEVESAHKIAEEIRALGRKTITIQVDVTKSEETQKMAAKTLDRLGMIDVLVNCAGGPAPVDTFFHESVEEVWDRVIAVNLKGVRNCTRAVINHMIDRRSGKIVSIASLSGLVGGYSKVDYSAAKAGVIGFTMALAKEVASYGINVNCISPGPIMTRALQMFPDKMEVAVKATGLGRTGEPEEVAALVVFLASDEANFITGQNYPICGVMNLGS